jgi:N-acetylmuramoyl-L-alanine amidase
MKNISTEFTYDDKMPFEMRIDQDSKCPIICHIDCGHGGMVNGVYQTNGKMCDHGDFVFYEGVFNRVIGKALAVKFYQGNISYNFTTTSNYDTPLPERIEKVGRLVKHYKSHKHILLSLHANAFGVESTSGFEYFTTPGVTESDYAANFYYPYILDLGMKMRISAPNPNEYDKESRFYVILKGEEVGCVSLLFEAGFMTNKEEALKMLTPEFQNAYVNALYLGTQDIITQIDVYGSIKK